MASKPPGGLAGVLGVRTGRVGPAAGSSASALLLPTPSSTGPRCAGSAVPARPGEAQQRVLKA